LTIVIQTVSENNDPARGIFLWEKLLYVFNSVL